MEFFRQHQAPLVGSRAGPFFWEPMGGLISPERPVHERELAFKHLYFTLNFSLWPDFCINIDI
jgi:hypothetical protein